MQATNDALKRVFSIHCVYTVGERTCLPISRFCAFFIELSLWSHRTIEAAKVIADTYQPTLLISILREKPHKLNSFNNKIEFHLSSLISYLQASNNKHLQRVSSKIHTFSSRFFDHANKVCLEPKME